MGSSSPNTLIDAISGWVNNPASNYGMILKLEDAAEAFNNVGGPFWLSTRFYGPQGDGRRPLLTVWYSPPPGQPSWSSLIPGVRQVDLYWNAPAPNGGEAPSSYDISVWQGNA